MTPDQLRAEQAKCLKLLRDVFLTQDQSVNAYGFRETPDGPAYPFPNYLNAPSNDAAVADALCGKETY